MVGLLSNLRLVFTCGSMQVNVAQSATRELVVEQVGCSELPTGHVLFTGLRHSRLVGLGCPGVVWPRAVKDLIAVGGSTAWF